MILSVSNRTDVVAFYTNWFMNRYEEGFIDVRNPFNQKLVSRIYFEDVDLILFCTKNPISIVDKLNKIDKPIIFQITLTPYKKDIEPNVPPKGKIIEAIKKISDIVGIDNIYIRYDPIFISDKYNVNYHIKAFDKLCSHLKGYVKSIIVSFLDDYKNVRNNKYILKNKEITEEDYKKIGINFSEIALKNNMTVQTCCENKNLVEYGFIKKDCISQELAHKLTKKIIPKWKERNCNCAQMVDIGVYNSCKHFCKYCYANYDENKVIDNYNKHYEKSSLLIGNLTNDDVIKRRMK